ARARRGRHRVDPTSRRSRALRRAPADRPYDPRRHGPRGGARRRDRPAGHARVPRARSCGVTHMNIAMLLEMSADANGDRTAFGSRDDGITYSALRGIAMGVAGHVEQAGASTVALLHETSPLVPAALFGA